MKRREYLKSIVIFGGLGVISFPLFKWFDLTKSIDPQKIMDKKAVIAELAELIIPETDTPGAKSAGVQDFIVNVMINCNDVKQQNKFLSGIEDIEAYAVSEFGKDFLKCSPKEKHDILRHFSEDTGYSIQILNKINAKFLGQPFYPKLKSLTVEGYCISRLGATQGLAYDYIPGIYEACIPLKPNQKSWATK